MASQVLIQQGERTRARMLEFIRAYVDDNGFSPTIQEICVAVDVASPNAVRNHLLRMQDEGVLSLRPRVARSIVLLDAA